MLASCNSASTSSKQDAQVETTTVEETTAEIVTQTTSDGATTIVTDLPTTTAVRTTVNTKVYGTTNVVRQTYATTTTKAKTVSPIYTSVQSGTYTSSRLLILSTGTTGATIYYTTDGKTPTTSSAKYTSAITISKDTTIKAIGIKSGYTSSAVITISIIIKIPVQLPGNITASGSTALQPLLQAATPLFKSKYASTFSGSVTINGGGSGTGLSDVMSGAVDIGNSDVTPAQAGKPGDGLLDHKVCVVGVGLAVSDNVYASLKNISSNDLTAIYNGTKTNWNQIAGWTGGSLPIQVYYRKSGSGTRTLFETYGSFVKLSDAQIATMVNFTKKESSGDLETAIKNNPNTTGAIGYETLPYCKDLKLLSLDGVTCNYANIYTGDYNIWGYEHMYTKGTPNVTVQTFIDFITSADMAKTITDSGYGSMSSMKVSR